MEYYYNYVKKSLCVLYKKPNNWANKLIRFDFCKQPFMFGLTYLTEWPRNFKALFSHPLHLKEYSYQMAFEYNHQPRNFWQYLPGHWSQKTKQWEFYS